MPMFHIYDICVSVCVCVGDPRELSKSDNGKCTAHFDVEQVAPAAYEQCQENER